MFMTSPSMLVAPNVPRDVSPRLSGENLRAEEDNIFECFKAPVEPVLFVCKNPCAEKQNNFSSFILLIDAKRLTRKMTTHLAYYECRQES